MVGHAKGHWLRSGAVGKEFLRGPLRGRVGRARRGLAAAPVRQPPLGFISGPQELDHRRIHRLHEARGSVRLVIPHCRADPTKVSPEMRSLRSMLRKPKTRETLMQRPPQGGVALRPLAEVQLQAQVTRSATLDARAIGVMGVDAGLAAIIVARPSSAIGTAALAALSLSAVIAGRSLFLGGSGWLGPSVVRLFALRDTYNDRALQELVLHSLVSNVSANEMALARREPQLLAAFVLLAFAALLTLAAGIY